MIDARVADLYCIYLTGRPLKFGCIYNFSNRYKCEFYLSGDYASLAMRTVESLRNQ